MRSDVSLSSNTACAGTLASVAVRRREVEREGGGWGVKQTARSACRAHRAVTSRYVHSSLEGGAHGETGRGPGESCVERGWRVPEESRSRERQGENEPARGERSARRAVRTGRVRRAREGAARRERLVQRAGRERRGARVTRTGRAEAESGERMSQRGGRDRRGGRRVPGESGVQERERRGGCDWRGGRCEPGESGLEGGAGGETGAEGGAYRERAAQRAAKRAVVHELLLHKC